MPGMDGRDLLAREELCGIPVVVMTASEAVVRGGVPVLRKPFVFDALVAMLHAVLLAER